MARALNAGRRGRCARGQNRCLLRWTAIEDLSSDGCTYLLCRIERPGVTQNKVDWVLHYVHRNCRLIRDGNPGRPPRLSLTQLCAKQWEIITGRASEWAFVVWFLQCFDISSPSWGPFFNFDACMSIRWGGRQWLLRTCRRGVIRNKGRSSRGELWLHRILFSVQMQVTVTIKMKLFNMHMHVSLTMDFFFFFFERENELETV